MRELSVGLIGCGNFGRGLGERAAAMPGVRLAAVADQSAEAAGAFAAQRGCAALTVAELLSKDVEAVLIATPNDTHRDVVVAAAAHGKHIYCEKPMALSTEACDEMLAAAERAGVKLMVGHMQRLFPLLQAVREQVRAGALGEPLAVSVTRRDLLLRAPGSWLRERARVGGVLFQSTTHEFDWLRSCFGDVATVYAQAQSRPIQAYLDYPDTVFVTLQFKSGVLGSVHACMSDHVQAYHGAVNGSEGSLHFDLHRGELRLSRDGREVTVQQIHDGALARTYIPANRAILASFFAWLRDGTPPVVTAADGRAATQLAEAGYRSIREGRLIRL